MKEIVNGLIIQVLKNNNKFVESISLKHETNLKEDLGFDSFDLAELTVYIDEKFNIDIFETGIISTVGEIYLKLNIQ